MSTKTTTIPIKRKFVYGESQFDQNTFLGRVKHFALFSNPKNVFVSKKKLEKMKEILQQFKDGTLPDSVSDKELWHYQCVVNSNFARDGNKIPPPFSIAGYALYNIPLAVGMMIPNVRAPFEAFWQWANQSQNALLNHYNRSGEKAVDRNVFLKSYSMAVLSAISIALGSRALINRVTNEILRTNLNRIVPFLSVASANLINTFLMRKHELVKGIPVRDQDGNIIGTSVNAAKKGLSLTMVSRVVLSFFVMGFPPFIYPLFWRLSPIFQKKVSYNLIMQTGVVSATLFGVVPLMVSIFPQNLPIATSILEPKFHSLPQKNLYYNKGL